MIETGFEDYSLMRWSQEFSVGLSGVDSQHKKLLNFYNETIAHCSGNAAKEREYFDSTIDAFISLLAEHFYTEERTFFGTNYPQINEHMLDHLKLLEKMKLIKEEAQNNNWKMNLHVLAITLKDWFLYHFDSYDLSAKEYFRAEKDVRLVWKREAAST